MDSESALECDSSLEELEEEAKVIELEIVNVNKALDQSQNAIDEIQKTAVDELKVIEDKKRHQYILKEDISKYKCNYESEIRNRNTVADHISSSRKYAQDISKVAEVNCTTMQSLTDTIKTIESLLSRQKIQGGNVLDYIRRCTEDLDFEIDATLKNVSRENEINKDKLSKADEDLEILRKLDMSNEVDLAVHKELIKELREKLDVVLDDIEKKREECALSGDKLSAEESKKDELNLVKDNEQKEFYLNAERLEKSLEDVKDGILKLELNICTYQNSDKHQTERIKELSTKIRLQEEENLNFKENITKVSESIQRDVLSWSKSETDLREGIDTITSEIIKLEVALREEQEKLEGIEESILKKDQVLKEVSGRIANLQSEIEREMLKTETEVLKNLELQISSLSKQHQELSEEHEKLKFQYASLEHEKEKRLESKKQELNLYNSELAKKVVMEDEIRKTSIQEMSKIKSDVDMKTFQQTKEFEESSKLIKSNIELTEKELKDMSTQKNAKENELQSLTSQIAHLKEQSKTKDKMKKFLSSLYVLRERESSMKRSSSDIAPPAIKKTFVPQCSGSSADGEIVTIEEMRKLKEQRERKYKLRQKQRQMQKEIKPKPV